MPGQTYSFQLDVVNPLDDPLRVKLNFVRVLPPSSISAAAMHCVKELRDSRYMFALKQSSVPAPETSASSLGREKGEDRSESDGPVPPARSKFGWRVYPSVVAFPLNAFNEVWDLEESRDLLNVSSEVEDTLLNTFDFNDRREEAESDLSELDDNSEVLAPESRSAMTPMQDQGKRARGPRASATNQPGSPQKSFVQKGHTTSLFLDLVISSKGAPPQGHPIEVAMHVTYSYVADDSAAAAQGPSQAARKDFEFWTALRLGTIGPS